MSERLRTAQYLVACGISVIPVGRDKKPLAPWTAFQGAYPTPDNLQSWFGSGQSDDCNIGIVCGQFSNLVVVDADGPDGEQWAQDNLPETPLTVRTGKGTHRYYRHPCVPVRNKVRLRTGDTRVAVDIRADGGYVLAPGSRHPSGVMYELLGSWPASLDVLPVFDPHWIAAEPVTEPTPTPARISLAQDRDRLLARARAYLAAVGPAIEGQGGTRTPFKPPAARCAGLT